MHCVLQDVEHAALWSSKSVSFVIVVNLSTQPFLNGIICRHTHCTRRASIPTASTIHNSTLAGFGTLTKTQQTLCSYAIYTTSNLPPLSVFLVSAAVVCVCLLHCNIHFHTLHLLLLLLLTLKLILSFTCRYSIPILWLQSAVKVKQQCVYGYSKNNSIEPEQHFPCS